MKIYISGPITGHPLEKVEGAFAEAAAIIRRSGHDPVNPLNNGLPQSATWYEHMRADLKMLLECDAIYMIGEWWHSSGAKTEWELSRTLGMPEFVTISQAVEYEPTKTE